MPLSIRHLRTIIEGPDLPPWIHTEDRRGRAPAPSFMDATPISHGRLDIVSDRDAPAERRSGKEVQANG